MRIFEYFILEGEQGLLNILYRMLDLKVDKICRLEEMQLMSYLRSGFVTECIEEYGIESLFIDCKPKQT